MVSPGDIVQTVAILAMMVLPGFLLGKFKLAGDGFATGLSNFVLYVAQSCMFIRAFLSTPVTSDVLRRMAIIFILSIAIHFLFTGIAFMFYRGAPDGIRRILRFSTIFTNAGYMSIAMFEILFPDLPEATVYASVYLVFFNMYMWSLGAYLHTNDRACIRPKAVLLNPAIVSSVIGFVLFLLSAGSFIDSNPILMPVSRAVSILGSTVCPLSMVVVGTRLGMMSFKGFFRDKYLYLYLFVRLLLSPVLVFGILKLLGLAFASILAPDEITLMTTILLICASTPAATSVSMLAEKFGTDTAYAGKLVSVSTLLSVVTIPLVGLLLLL